MRVWALSWRQAWIARLFGRNWPIRSLLGSHRYFHLGEGLGLVRLNSGRFIYVDPLEESVCSHLIAYGAWEPDTTRVLLGLLTKGDHVLEVGAHVGFHTLGMAHKVGATGRVTSLEANPRLAALAERSVRFNRYQGRVTILSQAASDISGPVRFTMSRQTGGGGHLYLFDDALGADTQVVDVQAVRLDDLDIAPPRLIRLDAEGAEGLILAGAERLLDRADLILCMEWDPVQMSSRRGPAETARWLSAKGFRFWRIMRPGRLTETSLDALSSLTNCDLVIAREPPPGVR